MAFLDPELAIPRIGHLDWKRQTIQPLAFASGRALDNLYQVISISTEQGITCYGDPIPLNSVKLLPPISGRDILAVGKNYAEHAVEFNKSGYDCSDKVDQPTHPVFFTKRASSIVAHGDPVKLYSSFTQTLDYEGELGVIIRKGGLGIAKKYAMEHVWGYTIINDVTARERQRDHKQFFIGKSGDTYCPMLWLRKATDVVKGPVAVPAKDLPDVLQIKTFVNGQERQTATTQDLIFSISTLVETLSEGITLRPGDVIATGTPAGVGFGQSPPAFLNPGDTVEVVVTGLGSLKNRIIAASPKTSSELPLENDTVFPYTNTTKSITGACLTRINNKPLYYKREGSGSSHIVFIHGLGGSMEFFTPFINILGLDKSYQLHLADLEGHGLSPTSALSVITISSLVQDVDGVFEHAGLESSTDTTLVAHSLGCIVALKFAIQHPEKVKKLILLGPPPNPLPPASVQAFNDRAALVRRKGMLAVVEGVASAGTSERSKSTLGLTAVRMSLLGTEPESYAKACVALAACEAIQLDSVQCATLIVTGDEDKVSPLALCVLYAEKIPHSLPPISIPNVGH
ncbi:putative protein YisK [Penicillium rolfsii]|nr:putative protein YisK [Penicillium rolfsii]